MIYDTSCFLLMISLPSLKISKLILFKKSYIIEIIIRWVSQLCLLIISFNLLQLTGDVLEFYKKNVIVIIIYLILFSVNAKVYYNREEFIYKTYGLLSFICLLISILTIILTIIGNKVFFSKLSIID